MDILKVKQNGEWVGIPAIKGEDGYTPQKGVDYFDGAPGAPGEDGVSPTVSVTPITDGNQVTITDKTGPHTFNVMNGAKGDPGDPGDPTELIDDTAGSGETGKTWSADKLADLDNAKAPVIINSASGAIASFSDGAEGMPLEDCVVQIEPLQDLHGYESPWPAGGGKNILPPFEKGVGIHATTGAFTDSSTSATTGKIPVNFAVNDSYYISGLLTTVRSFIAAYNSNDEFLGRSSGSSTANRGLVSKSFNSGTPSGTGDIAYLRVTIYEYNDGTGVIDDIDSMTAQLEVGSSASSYVPYSNICPITGWTGCNVSRTNGKEQTDPDYVGTTYPISWQTEAGTVYGGTLNVTTGVLVVDRATKTFNGSESWASYADVSNNYRYRTDTFIDRLNEKGVNGTQIANYLVSTVGDFTSGNSAVVYSKRNSISFSLSGTNRIWVYVPDLLIEDSLTAWKAYLVEHPLNVCYKLATPITYHLTPTEIRSLLNQNNIFADCGDVSVEYRADTKGYVDKAISAVPVQDVQVNGVSVLNQGVANVPMATANNYGVVKLGSGLRVQDNTKIAVTFASDTTCKEGTNTGQCITPSIQNAVAFYGLAKAAGADMASSSNPVGTYTEAAKKAIRKMLGIPNQEWEKIGEYTVAEDTALFEITTDSNGQPFKLSQMLVKVWLEASTTETRDFISATNLAIRNDDVNVSVSAPTKRYVTNTGSACYMQYESSVKGGSVVSEGYVSTSPGSTQSIEQINYAYDNVKGFRGFRLSRYSSTQTLVPAGTVVKLYGIRIDE